MKLFRYSLFCLISAILIGCTETPTGKATQKTKLQFLTEEYAPLNFSGKNEPVGMAVDIVNSIGSILNIKPEIKVQLWKDSYHTALTTPNVILFSAVKIKQRENELHWLKPSIMKFEEYFYKKNGRDDIEITKPEDLRKYKIGTTTDFSSEEYLKEKGYKNLTSYSTQEEAVKALMNDKVDLIPLATFRAEILIKKLDYSISSILPAYKNRNGHLYIAISKGTSKDVVNEWQAALDKIRENKTYYKIYTKWFFNHTF